MQIREGIVHFEPSDMAFVNRFGPAEAARYGAGFQIRTLAALSV